MKKGFTLIELLVVIAIIDILAAIVFVSLWGEEKTTDYNQCYREYIKCEKQR